MKNGNVEFAVQKRILKSFIVLFVGSILDLLAFLFDFDFKTLDSRSFLTYEAFYMILPGQRFTKTLFAQVFFSTVFV